MSQVLVEDFSLRLSHIELFCTLESELEGGFEFFIGTSALFFFGESLDELLIELFDDLGSAYLKLLYQSGIKSLLYLTFFI
jgi:hypothetical protein